MVWNVATQSMMKPQMKKTGYYSINLMKPNKKIVTDRNIRARKFATSRSGYTITVVEKGGVAV